MVVLYYILNIIYYIYIFLTNLDELLRGEEPKSTNSPEVLEKF